MLNRRNFLKLSAAGGAFAYVTLSGGDTVIRALAPELSSQADVQEREALYNSVCSNNCKQACRIVAHVYKGRLVKTSPNPMPEPRYNRICLRGLSHAQRVYHPDRLKYPMQRVGPRGSNEWKRILGTRPSAPSRSRALRIAMSLESSFKPDETPSQVEPGAEQG